MHWIRRHPRESVAGAVAVIGLLLMVLAAMSYLNDGSDDAAANPDTTIGPSVGAPLGLPADASLTDPSETGPGLPAFGGNGAGLGTTLDGLAGEGGTRNLPKIRIEATITSKSPIGTIGYIVPSSTDDPTKTVTKVGTSWSRSFIGYGPPDYIQLFAAAGGSGNPVTCTVTINGRVTEQRSTDGPYGQLFCQG